MQHEIAEEKPSVRAGCGSWAAQWAPAFAGETVLRTKSKIQEAARGFAPVTKHGSQGVPLNWNHIDYIAREHAFRRGYVRGVQAMIVALGDKLTSVDREKVRAWADSQVTPWPSEPGAAFTAQSLPEL